jgi:sodium/hydrogen antiporter
MLGWFGLRGIGSLYYVAYALRHGGGGAAEQVVDLAVTVVAVSVVVHGVSATPILAWYERIERARKGSPPRVAAPRPVYP